jgi:hypothetical protein
MKFDGWETTTGSNASTFFREQGDLTAYVTVFGGTFGSWGYTIWKLGDCLLGSKSHNWTAQQAIVEAEVLLASMR